VKAIEFIDDTSDVLIKSIKPNFKVLGPKYGKDVKFVVQAINQLDKEGISKLEKEGSLMLSVNGEDKEISIDEVEITSQDIEGWLVASQNNITVALDIHIDDKLKNEGIARELVNRIQNLRKDSGFEVTDRISIAYNAPDEISFAIKQENDYIIGETLSNDLISLNKSDEMTEFVINEEKIYVKISKD